MAGSARVVVITGATGNLGTKLRVHLEALGGYDLRLVCLNPEHDPAVVTADLGRPEERWTALFEGADAVVHLAGHARNQASWQDVTGPNIDALIHVYLAAARHRVPRVVFASSVWTMYGHRFAGRPFAPTAPAHPTNPYGATKLFGERVGQCFYGQHGIEGVAFRIGACQRGENRPSEAMTRGDWEQGCWVSNRDLAQGFERAVSGDYSGFHVLNLVSANEGSRWDISRTREVLGYVPQDGHRVRVRPGRQVRSRVAQVARFMLPSAVERWVDPTW